MIRFLALTLLICSSALAKDMWGEYNMSKFAKLEKSALDSLRNLAGSELTEEYMKQDYFLARWLLAKDFNVPEALELLRKNLEWRAQLIVSTILEENWDYMQVKFPYTRDTFDLEGRPILYFDWGQFDIANFLLVGGGSEERFLRYFVKIHEETNVQLYQLRSQGKDVYQYKILFNMGDFSLTRHVCLQCLQLYRSVATTLTENYPFASALTAFVNTPTLLKLTHSVLVQARPGKRSIIMYGQDRNQWKAWLETHVHPDQFPAGLKVDKEPEQKDNSDGLLHWIDEL